MKTFNFNNLNIKVGTSAKENWNILSESKPYHLFFHLSSFPSCFVILECNEDTIISNDVLQECANICKSNTKYRNMKNIKVDYTHCENVIKEKNVGEVSYKSNRKIKQIFT
jgi:predicted ribosome quality control (RQC) complex YloA/Tae2 family protein